jgi:UDP-glucose 4-epimerase
MKKILITGANSYVGTNVEKWLMKEPDKYYVETLDMKDSNWKKFDFSIFDVVFHVAGIAHVTNKKNMADLYFKVNRDLTIDVAKKSKISGVKQFIFMSSMIVYNSGETRITLETKPNPDNFYGQSKLDAEIEINKLSLLASLHDIGKTSINEKILNKADNLTEEEYNNLMDRYNSFESALYELEDGYFDNRLSEEDFKESLDNFVKEIEIFINEVGEIDNN